MHPLTARFDPPVRSAARAALVAALAFAAVAAPAVVHAQKGQAPAAAAPAGGAIQGYVYLDADGDGAFGPSESAVAGVPIRLLGPEGADTAATDTRGFYQFTGLGGGSYAVAIDTTALAVLLGTTDGLDVPGYDTLTVAGETLSGVNFALDAAQVGLLAEALAKAVTAVQAALPNGLPGATDALTATAAGAAVDTGAEMTATTVTTSTTDVTATTELTTATAVTTTARPSTKGGRQTGGRTAAMTTTTTAAATDAASTTAAAATTATMAGVVAAAETAPGSPATMPGGGLADLFGPGALAAIASVLGLLGGIGAAGRRRSRA